MASIIRSDLATVAGCDLATTYGVANTEGPGKIYWVADGVFHVRYTESGVAYGETDKSDVTVEHQFDIQQQTASARRISKIEVVEEAVEKWGINFPGVVRLYVADSEDAGVIYLPGVRMYDPTGRTGDAHASERIGPSCAAFQTTVSVIEIAAVYHGATLEQLRHLHEAFRPCVVRYHGRVGLFDYMFRQLEDVVYQRVAATPFSSFTQDMTDSGKLDINNAESAHTKIYLTCGKAPPAYFRKVKAKDDVDGVVRVEDKATFESYLAQ